jgi:hypothetical protein
MKFSKITLRQWYMVDNGVCSTIVRWRWHMLPRRKRWRRDIALFKKRHPALLLTEKLPVWGNCTQRSVLPVKRKKLVRRLLFWRRLSWQHHATQKKRVTLSRCHEFLSSWKQNQRHRVWFPHSTLKFSVSRRRFSQIWMRRKVLPPGGCVCTLHDTLGLAALFLTFKINFNIKKVIIPRIDNGTRGWQPIALTTTPPINTIKLQTIITLFFSY